MPNVSVILPILNEEEIIEESIKEVVEKISNHVDRFEIIAVNDGSTDKTATVLKNLQKKEKRIKIVSHRKNKGYGAVMKTGLKYANFPWIFFTDSDMQFDVKEIKNFLNYTDNFDFIVGFRKKRADSPRRKFISHIYNGVIRVLFNLRLRDVDCAFKLMRRASLQRIPFQSNSFFVSAEIMVRAHKLHFRVKELGVNHYPRKRGVSKVTSKQIIYTVKDLFYLFLASM